MGISTIAYFITMGIFGIQWLNDYIATRPSCISNSRNWTREDYLQSTPKNNTVIKLPNNISRLPNKIKKILNIRRDLIEISKYCEEMIKYNRHIIKKFYVPDYRKLLQRPLHRVPV